MPLDNIQKEYNLSREAASRLLKVSIRTLDRYLKAKKMSTTLVDGRIWLNKKEIEEFKDLKSREVAIDKVDMSIPKMSIDTGVDKVDSGVDIVDTMDIPPQDFVDILGGHGIKNFKTRQRTEDSVYKKLYTELRQEMDESHERLEIANYRVGQLENQLKNSIPLLEYHRENYAKEKFSDELKNKFNESMGLIKTLYLKIKYQKFTKRVFILILLAVLALQPLWLFFLYKS